MVGLEALLGAKEILERLVREEIKQRMQIDKSKNLQIPHQHESSGRQP